MGSFDYSIFVNIFHLHYFLYFDMLFFIGSSIVIILIIICFLSFTFIYYFFILIISVLFFLNFSSNHLTELLNQITINFFNLLSRHLDLPNVKYFIIF